MKETYSVNQDASRAYQLYRELDGVRGCILATIPLPNVQSVYATVCAESNRQEAMLGGESSEGSVFAVK
ncbi:Beta-galactosidase, partial [Trifolium medium]|nr:Beta-galactosidase [Trifolium medium]